MPQVDAIAKPKPLVVWTIGDWGAYLVRSTEDVDAARIALAEWLHQDDPAMSKQEAEEYVRSRLRAVVGWWRCNPCACGEGHAFDLGDGKPGQRGSFPGVEFSP